MLCQSVALGKIPKDYPKDYSVDCVLDLEPAAQLIQKQGCVFVGRVIRDVEC